MILQVKDLSFSYRKNQILSNISFHAEKNQVLAVLGPNGVGKSTLFQSILGLKQIVQGQIFLFDQDIQRLTPAQIASNIAYIPQIERSSFHYTVSEMVLMGTTVKLGLFSQPGKEELERAEQALKQLNLLPLAHRDFQTLSGGEARLVLLARALAQGAKILIMDEPTSGLDYGNSLRVMNILKSLTDQNYTLIFSTHEPNQALNFSDSVLALYQGRVAAFGKTKNEMTPDLLYQLYRIPTRIEAFADGQQICIPLPNKEDQIVTVSNNYYT